MPWKLNILINRLTTIYCKQEYIFFNLKSLLAIDFDIFKEKKHFFKRANKKKTLFQNVLIRKMDDAGKNFLF